MAVQLLFCWRSLLLLPVHWRSFYYDAQGSVVLETRRMPCRSRDDSAGNADTPSPSLLKRLLKWEWGAPGGAAGASASARIRTAARLTRTRTSGSIRTAGAWPLPALPFCYTPTPDLVGVSIEMERGCQRNNSAGAVRRRGPLADARPEQPRHPQRAWGLRCGPASFHCLSFCVSLTPTAFPCCLSLTSTAFHCVSFTASSRPVAKAGRRTCPPGT